MRVEMVLFSLLFTKIGKAITAAEACCLAYVGSMVSGWVVFCKQSSCYLLFCFEVPESLKWQC